MSVKTTLGRKAANSVVKHSAHGVASKAKREPVRASRLLLLGALVGGVAGFVAGRRAAPIAAPPPASPPPAPAAPAAAPAPVVDPDREGPLPGPD